MGPRGTDGKGSSKLRLDDRAVGTPSEVELLTAAATALLGCRYAEDVFAVIGDFVRELVPDALVIVNEATPDLDWLTTRRIVGLDDAELAKAADLVGFHAVGKQSPVSPALRPVLLGGRLSRIDGGFPELAGSVIPTEMARAAAELFGIEEVYTIGITDGEHVVGNIHMLLRTRDAQLPNSLVESFVKQCYLALVAANAVRDLAEKDESRRLLLRDLTVGLALHEVILDEDGRPCDYRYLEVNPAFESATGLKAEDVVGRTVRDVIPALETSWIERFGEVALTGVPIRFEDHAGGLDRYFDVSAYSPRRGQVASVVTDITELRHAEDKLRESEAQKSAILNGISTNIALVDRELKIRWVNQAAAGSCGKSPGEMVGRQCYFFWGDSLKPCESCPTLTAIETGRSEHKIVRTPDGRVWDEAGEPILDDDGNVVAVVEIAQDITEHDLAQAAIESSRKSIADVLDTAPFQIWSFNGATYDYVNREYFDFTGLKSEGPLTPETWTAYVHPDDLESAQRVWLAAWEAKAEHDNFFRLMREDGVYRDFWCHAVPIFDEAGEFQRFQGYNIDISERKTAEEALIAGERRFRAAIGASPVPMALTDQESNITFLNPAFTKTLGYTREDLPTLAQWWPSAYPDPEYRRSTMDAWGAELERIGRTGEVFTPMELSVVCADGTDKTLLISAAPLGGSTDELLAILYDITERKEAQEDLRRSEAAVRERLRIILEPDGDVGGLELADLIEAEELQSMMEELFRLTKVGFGVTDLHGNVLVGVGWQDICTAFHRVHPDTLKNCRESDLVLAEGVPAGQRKAYICKNNLWDIVTPIEIAGTHIGNVFGGQFFYEDEVVDRDVFRAQAREHGFAEVDYLAALDRVPRWPRETVDAAMTFYARLADMIATSGYARVKLSRALAQKDALLNERERHVEQLTQSLSSIVAIVSQVVETRDPYTAGHQRRVSELAVRISEELGMSPGQTEAIRIAGLLHDVGKMSVPAEILSKPGELSALEFELIKGHAESGYQIIASADMAGPIDEIVHQHHERCDGSGYPRGLGADELLPESQVMMVADVVEAMVSHRPYRPGLGVDAALGEIERGAGLQYDAGTAAACVRVFRERGFAFSEV